MMVKIVGVWNHKMWYFKKFGNKSQLPTVPPDIFTIETIEQQHSVQIYTPPPLQKKKNSILFKIEQLPEEIDPTYDLEENKVYDKQLKSLLTLPSSWLPFEYFLFLLWDYAFSF